jgi:hypothetical protein
MHLVANPNSLFYSQSLNGTPLVSEVTWPYLYTVESVVFNLVRCSRAMRKDVLGYLRHIDLDTGRMRFRAANNDCSDVLFDGTASINGLTKRLAGRLGALMMLTLDDGRLVDAYYGDVRPDPKGPIMQRYFFVGYDFAKQAYRLYDVVAPSEQEAKALIDDPKVAYLVSKNAKAAKPGVKTKLYRDVEKWKVFLDKFFLTQYAVDRALTAL